MNNTISLIEKSQLTMSSREIAELTDKRHPDVKRDIQNMFDQLEIDARNFAHIYVDARNRNQSEYLLPKKYIECLLTGYSIPLRMKVIDRLHELEEVVNQNQLKMPTTKELALMVIKVEEEKEQLLLENKNLGHQVEEMRDDVQALDRISKSDGGLNLTSTAKHLQQPPIKFNQFLRKEGWIYKRRGQRNWLGYQDKVKQGLLEHKVTIVQTDDGNEKICEQVLVTPKGLTKLSQIINTSV